MRVDDVRDALVSLEQRMDRRFERMEQRLDSIEIRFDSRFDRMNSLLMAMLVAIVGGMGGIIAAILQR